MSEQQKPDSKGALLPEALPFFWAALDFTSTTQRLVVRAVVILFKQTGDAPILKQNKVKVSKGGHHRDEELSGGLARAYPGDRALAWTAG